MRKKFLNDKVLIVGITLPIIMIILFWLAASIPKYFVSAPRYNFIFSTGYPDFSGNTIKFNVIDRKLKVQLICKNICNNYSRIMDLKLYMFDVTLRKIKQINISFPVIEPDSKSSMIDLNIPELDHFIIDPSLESPDGYKFNNYDLYSNTNFIDGIFGMNTRNATISKNNYIIVIPSDSQTRFYDQIRFIGWIIPENGVHYAK